MTSEIISLILGILERGLIFSLPVIAVYLSSRVIHFDDLTTEGSFGIGSAITALCLLHNIPWMITLPLAILGGGACGIITGLLHTKLNINKLISGIITTTGAFSITLVLAGAFLSVSQSLTIFDLIPAQFGQIKGLLVLLPLSIAVIFSISWFLNTQIGFILRALGNNPHIITLIGKNKEFYTIMCLFLSNALTALSGSLFVQYTGYFSIWTQVGLLILALAGLMLSEMLSTTFGIAIVVGPILFQVLISLTFELQLDPSWNKLITALLMIILFTAQKVTQLRKLKCSH